MVRIFIVANILLSAILYVSSEGNDKWKTNDDLLNLFDKFYYSLPNHLRTSTQKERYTSIVALAISYYVSLDKSIPHSDAVRESVAWTKNQLDRPTDALAEASESILILLRSVIDKPINDIKVCCTPQTSQAECDDNLKRLRYNNELSCRGYMRNVEQYQNVVNLMNNSESAYLISQISNATRISDDDAIKFFRSFATGRHRRLIMKMREFYLGPGYNQFRCNALYIPFF